MSFPSARDLAVFFPEFPIFTAGCVPQDAAHQVAVFNDPRMDPFKQKVELEPGVRLLAAMYPGVAGQEPAPVGEQMLQGLFNSFILLAAPQFIVAANIMNSCTISDWLLRFCVAAAGRFRGGLGKIIIGMAVRSLAGAVTEVGARHIPPIRCKPALDRRGRGVAGVGRLRTRAQGRAWRNWRRSSNRGAARCRPIWC